MINQNHLSLTAFVNKYLCGVIHVHVLKYCSFLVNIRKMLLLDVR